MYHIASRDDNCKKSTISEIWYTTCFLQIKRTQKEFENNISKNQIYVETLNKNVYIIKVFKMRLGIALIIFVLIVRITKGQITSNGLCLSGLNQDDGKCEIQNMRHELELQSEILREMRDKFIKQETRDCSDILRQGHSASGVYDIYQPENKHVFCDMETDGGGWTVLLNRQNADVDFDRSWADYKHGFGHVSGNHWLGNEYLFRMTSQRYYKLRIDLSDWEDEQRHAVYSFFRIGPEFDNYQLLFNEYLASESNVGDSLSHHNGVYFTTKDRDNDERNGNCADIRSGAVWFKDCETAGLTNYYGSRPDGDYGKNANDKMNWDSWHGPLYALKRAKMMIRPIN